jgi:probable sporulation protein (polysaccharide deacetylase family)
MLKPFLKQTIVMFIFFIVVFLAINQSGSIAHYVAAVKWKSTLDPSTLYERILIESEGERIEPINARVDPIWKAIPGLNGREVDIDQTYKLMVQQKTQTTIPFVYREISPQVQLKDLGAVPIYKGNPKKQMISLMINVAWEEENIPAMLAILREENVKATFFFLGSWLREHPDVAKLIASEGHECANHAYSHANMSGLSNQQARVELEQTQQLIKDIVGADNRLFAPPSGDYDENTVKVAHDLGLQTVLWTLDTVDWKEPPADTVVRKIASRLEAGSLILMHPTRSATGALRGIIREAKHKGLTIGTVSDLISPERVITVEPMSRF